MPDNILLIVFGILSLISLGFGILGFAMAVRSAKKPNAELQMVGWAILGLAGLVFTGMAWAYFVIPILANWIF